MRESHPSATALLIAQAMVMRWASGQGWARALADRRLAVGEYVAVARRPRAA